MIRLPSSACFKSLIYMKMKKWFIVAAMAALSAASAGAQDPVEVDIAADVVNQYVWRGQYCGAVSLQPALGIGYKGLSLEAWGNVGLSEPADDKELDLTLSYAVDVETENQRAENTVKAVSRIFYGIPLKYYLAMDEAAVADASTAVGGVELEALEAIPGSYYAAGDTVLLMGEDAYRYVQYRDINVFESALDRQERQVQFVKAFLRKAASNGAGGLIDLYNGVADEVCTNLGASEVSYLATLFATGRNSDFDIVQLKGTTEEAPDANGVVHEHYYLDADSVTKTMLDTFYTQVD